MAVLDKVEVQIKCNGQVLPEYDDPEATGPSDGLIITKYIEAIPGAQFSIDATLPKGYQFHGANAARITLRMDGLNRAHSTVDKDPKSNTVTKPETRSFRYETIFDEKSAKWRQASFQFGDIEISVFYKSCTCFL